MVKKISVLFNPNEPAGNQFYFVALAALAWGGLLFLQGFFDPLRFSIFENYAWIDAIVSAITASIWPAITWFAIGRAFSRMNEALMAVWMTLLVGLVTQFVMLLPGVAHSGLFSFVKFWLAFLPALVFGIATFRDAKKALYLVIAVIAAKGLGYVLVTDSIERSINSTIHFFDAKYVLYILADVVELPIQYLLLHYFIESLILGSKNIMTFTRWGGLPMVRRREYSLLYWLMGTALMLAIVGIGDFLIWGTRISNYLTMQAVNYYIYLLAIIIGIFVVASVYRNYLVSYFIGNGKPIGWNYYLLNIPLVNIFAWLFSLKRGVGDGKPSRDNSIGQNSSVVVIKRLMYILLALTVAINLIVAFDQRVDLEVIINIVLLVVSSGFLVLYLKSSSGVYLVYGVTSVMLIAISFLPTEFLKVFPPKAHIIGLLVLYPLFHGSVFRFSEK